MPLTEIGAGNGARLGGIYCLGSGEAEHQPDTLPNGQPAAAEPAIMMDARYAQQQAVLHIQDDPSHTAVVFYFDAKHPLTAEELAEAQTLGVPEGAIPLCRPEGALTY